MTPREKAQLVSDSYYAIDDQDLTRSLTDLVERALLDTIEESKAQQRRTDISIIQNKIAEVEPCNLCRMVRDSVLTYIVQLLENQGQVAAEEIRKVGEKC